MPNLRMDDPRVQNLFRCAEKVGLPVTCDGSDRTEGDFGLYDLPGVPLLEHTLQRFPRLKFIAHGPIFWSEVRRLPRPAMRKTEFLPNGTQVGFAGRFGKVSEEGVAQQLLRTYDNLYGELFRRCPYIKGALIEGEACYFESRDPEVPEGIKPGWWPCRDFADLLVMIRKSPAPSIILASETMLMSL